MAEAGRVGSVLVYVGGDLVGDGLMKLPVLRALRHAWPDAHIVWCAGKFRTAFAHELRDLVAGLVDETIEEAGFDRPLRLLLRRPLGGRRFDVVIDTQRGVPVTALVRRIRHGVFVSGAADFLLSERRPPRGYTRPESMAGQLLDLVALASGAPARADADLSIDPASREAAAKALPDGPRYVGFAPGAGGRHKCWPLDRFIALADAQAGAGRVPVFILGPDEADRVAAIRAGAPSAILPASHPGDGPPVSRSAAFTIAVGRRLAAAVANDAGAGHLLAAADAPLVSLFGPTRAAKFAPAARRLEVVAAQDFGSDAMEAIPVDAVAVALERLVQPDARAG
ncbi:MAG: lipopolysaccharide heptosyltransferase family protein [Alphaproteobacteria bacterium]|nr:lipopolysaccharide heptosyltransferase family protein [Alphaproteobacteria bacterium]